MKNDGGPAFPMQFLGINRGELSYEDTYNVEGMSLRDYFAGQVLFGLAILNFPIANFSEDKDFRIQSSFEISKFSYEIADAMLKERSK